MLVKIKHFRVYKTIGQNLNKYFSQLYYEAVNNFNNVATFYIICTATLQGLSPQYKCITKKESQFQLHKHIFSADKFNCSVVSESLQPHGLQHTKPPCPSTYNSWSSPKLMSIESVMPSNHLILCRPLLLLPSIFPSIKVFSNESDLHIRWPEYWTFSFNISLSNISLTQERSPLGWTSWISLQSRGLSKSLLQHHSSKASIL